MIFKWDAAKSAANVRKHGVDFREAASVLEDPLSTTFPDVDHSRMERRFVTVGVSSKRQVLVVAHADDERTIRIISARRATRGSMRKARQSSSVEPRAEYDFASMKGGVRGKYVHQLREGSNLVLLEPDLAEAFPSDAAVNDALRAALNVASVVSRSKTRTRASTRPRRAARR